MNNNFDWNKYHKLQERATRLNNEKLLKIKTVLPSVPSFAFFVPLVYGTPIKFFGKEYLTHRFTEEVNIMLTSANEVFLSNEFASSVSKKQLMYLIMSMTLEIVHLTYSRIKPYLEDSTTPFPNVKMETRIACASAATSLWFNLEMEQAVDDYFNTLKGCGHVFATIDKDNYFYFLGWEHPSQVPQSLRDIDGLLSGTLETLVSAFIRHHNPDNPPTSPMPKYGEATDEERQGKADEAFKAEAKTLAMRGVMSYQQAHSKTGGHGGYCPFTFDDLHLVSKSKVNYKHLLAKLLVSSNSDWGGFDRRNLNNVDYQYSMETEDIKAVIFIDTSGSTVGQLKDFLSEAQGILASFHGSRALIRYFNSQVDKPEGDNWITADTDIRSWDMPQTTGGTEFAPLKEYIEENHYVDNVIIISDWYFFDRVEPLDIQGQCLAIATEDYSEQVFDELDELGYMKGYSNIPY